MLKKYWWIIMVLIAFIIVFVGFFLLFFTRPLVASTDQFPIGRYAIAGASVQDGWNTIFVLLDTATGNYQILSITSGRNAQVEIRDKKAGRVE